MDNRPENGTYRTRCWSCGEWQTVEIDYHTLVLVPDFHECSYCGATIKDEDLYNDE